jgi:tRNA(Arg) A34 adenosine deaminase TadA
VLAFIQLGSPPNAPRVSARRLGDVTGYDVGNPPESNWDRTMLETLQVERDALVTLGILTHLRQHFDSPLAAATGNTPLHFRGYNVHSCVIDNADGSVLALDYNTNHSDENPLQHGEQRALRVAVSRVHEKRPRTETQSAEDYYRSLFAGTSADGLRTGCTLYNTLDPCVMCATTLLVCRMRRTAYLVEDSKFKGAWAELKGKYFNSDAMELGEIKFEPPSSKLIDGAADLLSKMRSKAAQLRQGGVRDILLFDHFAEESHAAALLLRDVGPGDLTTNGEDLKRNLKTLLDLKHIFRIPS